MNEIWKDIQGFQGYQVSNCGRIKSLSRLVKGKGGGMRIVPELIRKLQTTIWGYYKIILKDDNGDMIDLAAQRIVAKAFLPVIAGKPHVNHKDGNKKNNCVENLEWCDRSENQKHAYQMGLQVNPNRKIVLNVSAGVYYDSAKEAAFYGNYNYHTLRSMLNGDNRNKSPFIYV